MGSHLEGGHCGLLCKCRIFPTDAPVQLEQKCKDGLKILVTNILLTNMFNVLHCGVNPICTGDFGSFMTRDPLKMGGSKIEMEPHILPRLMPDMRFTTFRYLEPPHVMV